MESEVTSLARGVTPVFEINTQQKRQPKKLNCLSVEDWRNSNAASIAKYASSLTNMN